MPKKKKSKKTNPRKSFQTAKVGAGEGSDVSNNITRNNKDQKHGPENNYKQGAKSSGNLEIKKIQKLAKNTQGKTYQEVQDNNKDNTAINDNEKIVDNICNPGYDDILMQGTISRAIVNVDQDNLLLKKKDHKVNQRVLKNQKTQETGEANEIHKKHELISDAASNIDSEGRKNIMNGDSNITENKMMRGCCASGAVNIEQSENLGHKKVAENTENRGKKEFESCDTKKVGNIKTKIISKRGFLCFPGTEWIWIVSLNFENIHIIKLRSRTIFSVDTFVSKISICVIISIGLKLFPQSSFVVPELSFVKPKFIL